MNAYFHKVTHSNSNYSKKSADSYNNTMYISQNTQFFLYKECVSTTHLQKLQCPELHDATSKRLKS